jgi:hypothetical protein
MMGSRPEVSMGCMVGEQPCSICGHVGRETKCKHLFQSSGKGGFVDKANRASRRAEARTQRKQAAALARRNKLPRLG